jgi:hypothetical protein
MTVRTRVQPIDRDIALMLDDLSPKGRSMALATFAREQIDDARESNRQILGRIPRHTVAVDGRSGAALDAVKPDGVIIAEFELVDDALIWIGQQLEKHSPRLSGTYAKSHTVFADGVEIALGGRIPNASEYAFINLQPYARKIERGQSSKAPDGVYQVVATLARRRFGNVAKIGFSYRTAISGTIIGGRLGNKSQERNPAIIVSLRG